MCVLTITIVNLQNIYNALLILNIIIVVILHDLILHANYVYMCVCVCMCVCFTKRASYSTILRDKNTDRHRPTDGPTRPAFPAVIAQYLGGAVIEACLMNDSTRWH